MKNKIVIGPSTGVVETNNGWFPYLAFYKKEKITGFVMFRVARLVLISFMSGDRPPPHAVASRVPMGFVCPVLSPIL